MTTTNESDEIADSMPDYTPASMTPRELAERLEVMAHELRKHLQPVHVEALMVAAQRVRRVDSLREALVDRVLSTSILERELQHLRRMINQNRRAS